MIEPTSVAEYAAVMFLICIICPLLIAAVVAALFGVPMPWRKR